MLFHANRHLVVLGALLVVGLSASDGFAKKKGKKAADSAESEIEAELGGDDAGTSGSDSGRRPLGAPAEETAETTQDETAGTEEAIAAQPATIDSSAEDRPREDLENRADQSIYVVQRRAYSKSGDIEITPFFFTKVNPKFVGYLGPGLSLAYHIKENLALELSAALPFGFYSDLVYEVYTYNGLTPEQVDLKQVTFFGGLGLQYSAFYGKLELYGILLDYDFYATGGFDILTTVEPCAPPNSGSCSEEVDIGLGLQGPVDGGDAMKIAGHLGGGMRVFFHDLFGLRLEVRDIAYSDRKTEAGQVTTDIRNEVMIILGLSIMIPGPGGPQSESAGGDS